MRPVSSFLSIDTDFFGLCTDSEYTERDAGESVDWWFALKYPVAASASCAGQCYSYIDSTSLEWAQSSKLVRHLCIAHRRPPIYAN